MKSVIYAPCTQPTWIIGGLIGATNHMDQVGDFLSKESRAETEQKTLLVSIFNNIDHYQRWNGKNNDEIVFRSLLAEPEVKTIEQLKFKVQQWAKDCNRIVIDGVQMIPALLKCSTQALVNTLTQLEDFMHDGDIWVTMSASPSATNTRLQMNLIHCSQISVELSPLNTGRASDVSGVIRVLEPASQRALRKLYLISKEAQVTFL